jgi:hypothetical protein
VTRWFRCGLLNALAPISEKKAGLGLSHFALELSNGCTSDAACITNATVNGSDVQGILNFGMNSDANGDPGLPFSFYGVAHSAMALSQYRVVAERC